MYPQWKRIVNIKLTLQKQTKIMCVIQKEIFQCKLEVSTCQVLLEPTEKAQPSQVLTASSSLQLNLSEKSI